jgi:hypothetical protein
MANIVPESNVVLIQNIVLTTGRCSGIIEQCSAVEERSTGSDADEEDDMTQDGMTSELATTSRSPAGPRTCRSPRSSQRTSRREAAS